METRTISPLDLNSTNPPPVVQEVSISPERQLIESVVFPQGNELSQFIPSPVRDWAVSQIEAAWHKAQFWKSDREEDKDITVDSIRGKILHKAAHTHDVMKTAHDICREEGLEIPLTDVVTAALLHDMGRFPQALSGTFADDKTAPHALTSHFMFMRSELPHKVPEVDWHGVSHAVLRHGDKDYPRPDDYNQEGDALAKLLRDADKAAILLRYFDGEIRARKQIPNDVLSPRVRSALEERQLVKNADRKSPADITVSRLAWIYDLNFDASRRLFVNNNLLGPVFTDLASQLPENDYNFIQKNYAQWKAQHGMAEF